MYYVVLYMRHNTVVETENDLMSVFLISFVKSVRVAATTFHLFIV